MTCFKLKKFGAVFIILSVVACEHGRKLPPSTGMDAELNWCVKLSEKKQYKEAVECLEVFKSRYPSGNAAGADLLIGDNYFRQKEYLLAAESFQDFITQNPGHPKMDYAYYKSGVAYLKESPKSVDRDQEYLESAVTNFEMIVRYLPHSPYGKLATDEYNKSRRKLAQKHFYVGRFYYRYGEHIAAIPRFEEILKEYSGLGLDKQTFEYLIGSYKKTKQEEKARQAQAYFKQHYSKNK